MEVNQLSLSGIFLLTPSRITDNRGYFLEAFNEESFTQATGVNVRFVRDCMTLSIQPGTVRGLHYQSPPHAMTKLVSVSSGRIRDVVVDIRRGSPTYGKHLSVEMSADKLQQLFVPPGFLHGLVTLEPNTCVMYKMDTRFSAECDGAVRWNDPDLAIDWGIQQETDVIVSDRDSKAQLFSELISPFEYQLK